MNSIHILFPITIYLFVYSIIATYAFWLMLYRLRYLGQRLSTSKADISKLETAYENLRSLLERTGKNQAEVIDLIAEANNRIARLEDKRKAYQAPKATPRIPRPLRGKPAKQQPHQGGDQHQINDRDSMLLTAGENER
ncbi:hypothetical protein [uncultured Porphyromonas sp.]|uniref:hypothetical protein n=1 Tax=uncultured Porphyromonas sp. TaxID=159274 RepID=UPI0026186AB0|nr:hypothetical protein [uncultured Porphyromonas sp.]